MTNTFKLNEEDIRLKAEVGYISLKNISNKLVYLNTEMKKACDLINDLKEIGTVYYEPIDKQIIDIRNATTKYNEFRNFSDEYYRQIDMNFSKAQERVCDDLGDIVLENIQIRDTLGINHQIYTSCELDKEPLINLKDLLSYGEINTALKEEYDKNIEYLNALRNLNFEEFDSIEWPEGSTAAEIEKFKVYIQSLKENELDSFEEEISNFLNADKVPFITKGEEFLSIGLDLIPIVGQIKGLCEAISGEDLVTRREFSTLERWLILGTLLLDGKGLYSVGKAATSISIKEGGKQALKYTGRQFTKEFVGGVTFYGASSMASELGVSPKGQLAIVAGMFVFGNKGTIKAGVETANARLKGVSKNSLLDNLRLADKNTYDSIMKNLENSTRKNTVSLSSFGAGELQRIYDNNASLRASVKNFDELSRCIGSLSEVNKGNVYKILSGTDSKKISELSDVIKGASGDSKKISEYLSGVDTKGVSEARKIDIVNDADIILDVKNIRQSLPSRYKTSGNLATAEVSIGGIEQNKFFAHSGIDKMQDNLIGKADNISLQPDKPMFKAIEAPNKNGEFYLRDSCTEYKILNDIADRLKESVNPSGKIKLFTELEPCDSCRNVIDSFRNKFENIEIEVIHNGDVRVIPKNGY